MRSYIVALFSAAAQLAAASAVSSHLPLQAAAAAALDPLITTAPIPPQELVYRRTIDNAWSSLDEICLTYQDTQLYTEVFTIPTVELSNTVVRSATVPIAKISTSVSDPVSTVTVGSSGSSSGSPTGGSGPGSSSGGSSGSSSPKSKGESKAISKTAIIGIAVGSAGGAILLCAIIFVVYRCTKRSNKNDAAISPMTSVPGGGPPGNVAGTDATAAAIGASVATTASPTHGSELEGKFTGYTSVSPQAPPTNLPEGTDSIHESVPLLPQLYDQNGVPLDAATSAAIWQRQQQQQLQLQYAAQYAAAQQQQQSNVADYIATQSGHPATNVIYHEVPGESTQTHYPQELSTTPASGNVTYLPATH
ncbi:hypothetical protein SEPCBS57363_001868 [Sporothrix epigloea]|uniref:Mid2 domain-containing protein n=1 Tax=Sporothrix epigloea TaxID=1892477 RepID=A0ABP0DCN2_9PEZI